ncbi:MAG: FAD-binding oxidoreductase [Methylobacteriaceae bacterium]|nr:FAD-binding oxidoreductase [Methylobacteriaceae bacterium]
MPRLATFLSLLGDVPAISDPITVRRKSRDMTAQFSPIMRRELKDRVAEVIVEPRDEAELRRAASAAARAGMPVMLRGGGTANFGQGIPLNGGAVIDMTRFDRILAVGGGRTRVEAGARIAAIDDHLRERGFELRMHPSTKRAATIGGFVGGGHAGVGSCAYGILRDRGNLLGLKMLSLEAEPRMVELRGPEVNLVHHAYGTNGIITEVELPLAPAWPWIEAVVAFPGLMPAARFAHLLAGSDGIAKKLISVLGPPIPELIEDLAPLAPSGAALVLCMVAEPGLDGFRSLAGKMGGEVVTEAPEGAGPYHAPIYEFSWGHTRLNINRRDPGIISNIGLLSGSGLLDGVELLGRRFAREYGVHIEVKRIDGEIAFQAMPLFRFQDEDGVAAVMRGMAEDGAVIANNHTFRVKEGGMKPVESEDVAFKRRMDPHGLMNPGKMSVAEKADAEPESAGAALPSTGWRYRDAKAS